MELTNVRLKERIESHELHVLALINHLPLQGVLLRAVEEDFRGLCLERALLDSAEFFDCNFSSCRMIGVRLQGAFLGGCRFVGADLTGAELGKATCDEADFTDAKLHQVQAMRANFAGAIFVGAELVRATLTRAFFGRADLRGARLLDCDISGISLDGARMHGIEVRDCHIASPVRIGSIDVSVGDKPEILGGDAARDWLKQHVSGLSLATGCGF